MSKSFEEKFKFKKEQYENWGEEEAMPNDIRKKYKKYTNELSKNQDKLNKELTKLYSNNKITDEIDEKYSKMISNYKIFSLEGIPLINEKKETIKKPSSTLAKLKEEVNELIPTLTSAQKKLIVKIPHDTYTAKNIYQIIKYIHSGEIKKESEFPKAGKGDKVNLEDLIPIKKKNKNKIYLI